MKAHFEIEQGSIDWYLIKHGKIGGTRSAGLFNKTDTLFFELLAEMTERYDEDNDEEPYLSDAMERGKSLEPQARIELQKYTGIEFLECGWIQSDHELLGISPDGISNTLTEQCEIKCLGAKEHLRICLSGKIPLKHLDQCIHAFTVNPKLERMFFMAYRPESPCPIKVIELKRDDVVNIGTASKPNNKTIKECTEIAIAEANRLQKELKESINKLNF